MSIWGLDFSTHRVRVIGSLTSVLHFGLFCARPAVLRLQVSHSALHLACSEHYTPVYFKISRNTQRTHRHKHRSINKQPPAVFQRHWTLTWGSVHDGSSNNTPANKRPAVHPAPDPSPDTTANTASVHAAANETRDTPQPGCSWPQSSWIHDKFISPNYRVRT